MPTMEAPTTKTAIKEMRANYHKFERGQLTLAEMKEKNRAILDEQQKIKLEGKK